jgi:hypothetical protein
MMIGFPGYEHANQPSKARAKTDQNGLELYF